MNTKDNARSQNTRSRIKDAFLELVDEGLSPEEVSVTALCRRAGIHRSSFYLHYAVPTEILSEMGKEVMSMMGTFLMNLRQESPTEGVESILCFIRDNDRLFRTILLTAKGEELIDQFLTQSVIGIRESDLEGAARPALPYLQAYLCGGSRDVLRKWMANNYRESPQYVAELLTKVNQSAIFSLFQ